jgi:hypothetical protein
MWRHGRFRRKTQTSGYYRRVRLPARTQCLTHFSVNFRRFASELNLALVIHLCVKQLYKLHFILDTIFLLMTIIIYYRVRFEVFTAVTMKNCVFWDVMPCGSYKNQRFGGTQSLHHQGYKNRWTRNVSRNYERRGVEEKTGIQTCSTSCLRYIRRKTLWVTVVTIQKRKESPPLKLLLSR